MTSKFIVAALLCLALAGCELSDRVVPGGSSEQQAADLAKRRAAAGSADDDPISRAREAQEAAAAREATESLLRVQGDTPARPN